MLQKILNNYLSNNKQRNALLFWVFSVFVILIYLVCITNGKMGNDAGMWSYMGRVWLENDLPPYKNSIENKTPGIFILYAISHYFFGVNYFFPRLLGALTTLFTSFLIFKIGKDIYSKKAGLIGALIFNFSMLWEITNAGYLEHTETFMIFFNTIAFYLLEKNHKTKKPTLFVILGILLGFAIAFKQIAIVTLLGFQLYIIYYFKENLSLTAKLIGYSSLGVLLATLLSVIPLFWSGVSFREYIDGAWLILLNEGSSYPLSIWRIPKFFELFFGSKMIVFYPILAVGLFQVVTLKGVPFVNLLLFWIIIAFIGVNASGYYWGHQVTQLMPAISLLSSVIIVHNFYKLKSNIKWFLLTISIIFFPYNLFIKSFASIITIKSGIYESISNHISGNSTPRKIGDWIQNNTNKNDYVYYYGTRLNSILSYSNRKSASIYFNTFFITSQSIKSSVKTDLIVNKPKFIVKEKGVVEKDFIEDILKENYIKARNFSGYCKIYKRTSMN